MAKKNKDLSKKGNSSDEFFELDDDFEDFDMDFDDLDFGDGSGGDTAPKGVKGYFKNVSKSIKGISADLAGSYLGNAVDITSSVGGKLRELQTKIAEEKDKLADRNTSNKADKSKFSAKNMAADFVKDLKNRIKTGNFHKQDNGMGFDDDSWEDDDEDGGDWGGGDEKKPAKARSKYSAKRIVVKGDGMKAAEFAEISNAQTVATAKLNTSMYKKNLVISEQHHAESIGYIKNISENVYTITKYLTTDGLAGISAQIEYGAKALALAQDQSALLKDIKKLNMIMIGKKKKGETYEDPSQHLFDNGMFNFDNYFSNVKENASSWFSGTALGSLSSIAQMQADMGGGKQDKSLKGQAVGMMKAMLGSGGLSGLMINDKNKEGLDLLNNLIGGIPGAFIGKMNKFANESTNPLLSLIGQVLGNDAYFDKNANLGLAAEDIKKTANFDNQTYETINTIIPDYLDKIATALTGEESRYFDYTQHKFRTRESLRRGMEYEEEQAYRSNDYVLDAMNKTQLGATNKMRKDKDKNGENSAYAKSKLSEGDIKKGFDKIWKNYIDRGVTIVPKELLTPDTMNSEVAFEGFEDNTKDAQIKDLFRSYIQNLTGTELTRVNSGIMASKGNLDRIKKLAEAQVGVGRLTVSEMQTTSKIEVLNKQKKTRGYNTDIFKDFIKENGTLDEARLMANDNEELKKINKSMTIEKARNIMASRRDLENQIRNEKDGVTGMLTDVPDDIKDARESVGFSKGVIGRLDAIYDVLVDGIIVYPQDIKGREDVVSSRIYSRDLSKQYAKEQGEKAINDRENDLRERNRAELANREAMYNQRVMATKGSLDMQNLAGMGGKGNIFSRIRGGINNAITGGTEIATRGINNLFGGGYRQSYDDEENEDNYSNMDGITSSLHALNAASQENSETRVKKMSVIINNMKQKFGAQVAKAEANGFAGPSGMLYRQVKNIIDGSALEDLKSGKFGETISGAVEGVNSTYGKIMATGEEIRQQAEGRRQSAREHEAAIADKEKSRLAAEAEGDKVLQNWYKFKDFAAEKGGQAKSAIVKAGHSFGRQLGQQAIGTILIVGEKGNDYYTTMKQHIVQGGYYPVLLSDIDSYGADIPDVVGAVTLPGYSWTDKDMAILDSEEYKGINHFTGESPESRGIMSDPDKLLAFMRTDALDRMRKADEARIAENSTIAAAPTVNREIERYKVSATAGGMGDLTPVVNEIMKSNVLLRQIRDIFSEAEGGVLYNPEEDIEGPIAKGGIVTRPTFFSSGGVTRRRTRGQGRGKAQGKNRKKGNVKGRTSISRSRRKYTPNEAGDAAAGVIDTRGMGVMGEAGPEGILPLARDQEGDLGVTLIPTEESVATVKKPEDMTLEELMSENKKVNPYGTGLIASIFNLARGARESSWRKGARRKANETSLEAIEGSVSKKEAKKEARLAREKSKISDVFMGKELKSSRGKVLGGLAGTLMGGPMGGVIGALVGHGFDKASAATKAMSIKLFSSVGVAEIMELTGRIKQYRQIISNGEQTIENRKYIVQLDALADEIKKNYSADNIKIGYKEYNKLKERMDTTLYEWQRANGKIKKAKLGGIVGLVVKTATMPFKIARGIGRLINKGLYKSSIRWMKDLGTGILEISKIPGREEEAKAYSEVYNSLRESQATLIEKPPEPKTKDEELAYKMWAANMNKQRKDITVLYKQVFGRTPLMNDIGKGLKFIVKSPLKALKGIGKLTLAGGLAGAKGLGKLALKTVGGTLIGKDMTNELLMRGKTRGANDANQNAAAKYLASHEGEIDFQTKFDPKQANITEGAMAKTNTIMNVVGDNTKGIFDKASDILDVLKGKAQDFGSKVKNKIDNIAEQASTAEGREAMAAETKSGLADLGQKIKGKAQNIGNTITGKGKNLIVRALELGYSAADAAEMLQKDPKGFAEMLDRKAQIGYLNAKEGVTDVLHGKKDDITGERSGGAIAKGKVLKNKVQNKLSEGLKRAKQQITNVKVEAKLMMDDDYRASKFKEWQNAGVEFIRKSKETALMINGNVIRVFKDEDFRNQVGEDLTNKAKGTIANAKGLIDEFGNKVRNEEPIAMAKGGVVKNPTRFMDDYGPKLMGEAGTEAIMPLKRNKKGVLGVVSTGTDKIYNLLKENFAFFRRKLTTGSIGGGKKGKGRNGDLDPGETVEEGSYQDKLLDDMEEKKEELSKSDNKYLKIIAENTGELTGEGGKKKKKGKKDDDDDEKSDKKKTSLAGQLVKYLPVMASSLVTFGMPILALKKTMEKTELAKKEWKDSNPFDIANDVLGTNSESNYNAAGELVDPASKSARNFGLKNLNVGSLGVLSQAGKMTANQLAKMAKKKGAQGAVGKVLNKTVGKAAKWISGKSGKLGKLMAKPMEKLGKMVAGSTVGKTVGKFGKKLAAKLGKSFVGRAGAAVGKAATKGVAFLSKALLKMLKTGKIGKFLKKVAPKLTKDIIKKLGPKAGAKAAAGLAAKTAAAGATGGTAILAYIAQAVWDFSQGWRKTNRWFKLGKGIQPTLAMKIASGAVNAINGFCLGLIPAEWLLNTVFKMVDQKGSAELEEGRAFNRERALIMGIKDPDRLAEFETKSDWEKVQDLFTGGSKSANILGFGKTKPGKKLYKEWYEKKYKPLDAMFKEAIKETKKEYKWDPTKVPGTDEENMIQDEFRQGILEAAASFVNANNLGYLNTESKLEEDGTASSTKPGGYDQDEEGNTVDEDDESEGGTVNYDANMGSDAEESEEATATLKAPPINKGGPPSPTPYPMSVPGVTPGQLQARPPMGMTSGGNSPASYPSYPMGMVRPYAKGGIVNSPRFFGDGNGTNVMGEAGPEAIIPLKRDGNGNLGVSGGNNQLLASLNSHLEFQKKKDEAILGIQYGSSFLQKVNGERGATSIGKKAEQYWKTGRNMTVDAKDAARKAKGGGTKKKGLFGGIGDFFGNLFGNVSEGAGNVVENIQEKVGEAGNAVTNLVFGEVNPETGEREGGIAGGAKDLWDKGKEAVGGFINWITGGDKTPANVAASTTTTGTLADYPTTNYDMNSTDTQEFNREAPVLSSIKNKQDAIVKFKNQGALARAELDKLLANGSEKKILSLAKKIKDPNDPLRQQTSTASLDPITKKRVDAFMADSRIKPRLKVRETLRTPLTQLFYYTKGRLDKKNRSIADEIGKLAGFNEGFGFWGAGNDINTWKATETLSSNHFSGNAVDFDDINGNFLKAGDKSVDKIAKEYGLEWGGMWTNPVDPPHFQLNAGISKPTAMGNITGVTSSDALSPEGTIFLPNFSQNNDSRPASMMISTDKNRIPHSVTIPPAKFMRSKRSGPNMSRPGGFLKESPGLSNMRELNSLIEIELDYLEKVHSEQMRHNAKAETYYDSTSVLLGKMVDFMIEVVKSTGVTAESIQNQAKIMEDREKERKQRSREAPVLPSPSYSRGSSSNESSFDALANYG